MWNQPPATPHKRAASNGTAEGLWEHRFQSASSWDELAMWDSGEGQSSGGGYRVPALSITVLAASRTTPTWEREHQASTWALSLTAAPLNGTTFPLSPGWLDRTGWLVPSWHSKPPRPCHISGYKPGAVPKPPGPQQVHCHIRPVSGWRCWRRARAHR